MQTNEFFCLKRYFYWVHIIPSQIDGIGDESTFRDGKCTFSVIVNFREFICVRLYVYYTAEMCTKFGLLKGVSVRDTLLGYTEKLFIYNNMANICPIKSINKHLELHWMELYEL